MRRSGVKEDPVGGRSWRCVEILLGGLEGKEMKRGAFLLVHYLGLLARFNSLSSFQKQQMDSSRPLTSLYSPCGLCCCVMEVRETCLERERVGPHPLRPCMQQMMQGPSIILVFSFVAFTVWDFFAMKSCRSWPKITCVD